jgi:hypothetical protein
MYKFNRDDEVLILPSILEDTDCLCNSDLHRINGEIGIYKGRYSSDKSYIYFPSLHDAPTWWIYDKNLEPNNQTSFNPLEDIALSDLLGV